MPAFFDKKAADAFQSDAQWARPLSDEKREAWKFAPFAFNRIEGDNPNQLRGVTVNMMEAYRVRDGYVGGPFGKWAPAADGGSWKTSGLVSIDDILYLAISRMLRGGKDGDVNSCFLSCNTSIIRSADGGVTWLRSEVENYESPMFPGFRFGALSFIDHGAGAYLTAPKKDYVYAVSNSGYFDNGDFLILGRVPREKIGDLNYRDWRFYTGGDGSSQSNWATKASSATAVFRRSAKVSQTAISYLPGLERYLMLSWYHPFEGTGDECSSHTIWEFYDSAAPWGPWSRVGDHYWHPEGYYFPTVCPRFQSANKILVFTAGDWRHWSKGFYQLTLVPIELVA